MSLRTALHRPRTRGNGRSHRPGSTLSWMLDRPAATPAAREERQLLSQR
jgi:hypothetical protein